MQEDQIFDISPQKQILDINAETAELTIKKSAQVNEQKVDYKSKTFKLMKQLAQLEVTNKKNTTFIRHLQKQIEAYKEQLQKIMMSLQTKSLDEATKKIINLMHHQTHANQNNQKAIQWTNIVEQYKKIINTQQYKYIKLQQQYRIAKVKNQKYEQEKIQNTKENKNSKADSNEIQQLQKEIKMLKDEYKKAIIEKDNISEALEKLQKKYSSEIEHFQEMEKHVEERLAEVQNQMNYYRQQRQDHIEKITLLQKQLQLRESRQYFSFGGVTHKEVQTDFQQDHFNYNSQCLQVSIKTLLEENQRLKNGLYILYSKNTEQNLPKDVELELKILLNMRQNTLKQQNYDKQKQIELGQNLKIESKQYSSLSIHKNQIELQNYRTLNSPSQNEQSTEIKDLQLQPVTH